VQVNESVVSSTLPKSELMLITLEPTVLTPPTKNKKIFNITQFNLSFCMEHSFSVIIVFTKTMLSLNSNSSTNLVELLKVSRVWWITKYKPTILIHKHLISSKISTNSIRGSSCASRVFTPARLGCYKKAQNMLFHHTNIKN
jgi:hypothetical protein